MHIYYLKRDIKALISLVDIFRLNILRRKEITIVEKKAYNNLFRYMKKLVKIKYGKSVQRNENALEELKEKIRNSEHLVLKEWLLEEIAIEA